jgi:Na+-driven multidrug efflux pump
LVGQGLGEKNGQINKRLINEGLFLAGINMVLFALPFTLLSGPILSLFTKDPALIKACQNYLLWIYPGLLFVIFPIILGGVLRGAGNTKLPMVASMVSNVAFKLPAALILSKLFYSPVNGVWLAIALSVVIEAGIILYYYGQGKWVNEKI